MFRYVGSDLNDHMRHWIAMISIIQKWSLLTLLQVLLLAGCVSHPETQKPVLRSQLPTIEFVILQNEPSVSGQWNISGDLSASTNFISIIVRENTTGAAFHFTRRLGNLAFLNESRKPKAGKARYSNEVGYLEFSDGTGNSPFQFTFTPNFQFAVNAAKTLKATPTQGELLRLLLLNFNAEELQAYSKSGVTLSAQDLILFKAGEIPPTYVVGIYKGGNFTTDEVLYMNQYGVPATYPAELAKAGFLLRAKFIVILHQYGVPSEEVKAWNRSGYTADVNVIAKLHSLGIPPSLGAGVHGLFDQATVDDLAQLKTFGVDERFLSQLKTARVNVTLDDVIRLRTFNVPTDYIIAWLTGGYKFDASDVIKLNKNGIPKETAPILKDQNFKVEELVKLHRFGVPPDYVMAWRNAHYNFGVQDLIRLHTAGVPAFYAAALNVPGREPFSADTILRLRMKNLSIEEIRSYKEQ